MYIFCMVVEIQGTAAQANDSEEKAPSLPASTAVSCTKLSRLC
jgi:hypothetical protein